MLLPAEYVTLEQGTGCVHTAPGHGQEDFELGRAYGLEPYAPVDDDGRFTADVAEYEGEHVFEANPKIVSRLHEAGRLLNRPGDLHTVERYPHCWRTKTPLIFRATPQWFIRIDCNNLRGRTLEAVGAVRWVPPWGQARIEGMIQNRPDWCISRQRHWGVPLTILTCRACHEPAVDESLFDHIRELFMREGADAWFKRPVDELRPPGFACPGCGGTSFDKENDILDVWFDSGVSHLAVCDTDRYGLDWPADLYLEGQDQYRGWFQSSVTAAVGLKGRAPYREVVTHGFVVDADGHKMSKSLGNVITPQQLLKTYGADILRLWTTLVDFREDLRISDEIMKRNAEAYRKVRNTFRFLLGNLADFDPAAHTVSPAELRGLDGLVVRRARDLAESVVHAYRTYDLSSISHRLVNFCTVDLSSLYLDVLKDRLYCAHPDDSSRRAAQSAIFAVARCLSTLFAPILSFTADEVWEQLPATAEDSVHLCLFHDLAGVPANPEEDRRWDRLLALRETVNAQLEHLRQAGELGKSLEAQVHLDGDLTAVRDDLESCGADLAELLIVSRVGWSETTERAESCPAYPGLVVGVSPYDALTCERCWRRMDAAVDDPQLPDLCERCHGVVRLLVKDGRVELDQA